MTDPETSECAGRHQQTPVAELNADDLCEICAAIDSLRITLERQGKLKPAQQAELPYKDE